MIYSATTVSVHSSSVQGGTDGGSSVVYQMCEHVQRPFLHTSELR